MRDFGGPGGTCQRGHLPLPCLVSHLHPSVEVHRNSFRAGPGSLSEYGLCPDPSSELELPGRLQTGRKFRLLGPGLSLFCKISRGFWEETKERYGACVSTFSLACIRCEARTGVARGLFSTYLELLLYTRRRLEGNDSHFYPVPFYPSSVGTVESPDLRP